MTLLKKMRINLNLQKKVQENNLIDLNQELLFLSQFGLFNIAHAQIPNNSFDELKLHYDVCHKTNELDQASLYAQKISILYGLSGLYLYFPVQLSLIQKDKQLGEIVDQQLIKLLSLILFVEKNLPSNNHIEWITKTKTECLALCNETVKQEIQSEANDVCLYLEEIANKLLTPGP
jgi:hypothetical protein